MEKQLKWLWLALCLSSAAWLISQWIELNQQVKDGSFSLNQIQQSNQAAEIFNDQSDFPNQPAQSSNSPTDLPTDLPDFKAAEHSSSLPTQTVDDSSFIEFETNNYRGKISLDGGNLVELNLKKYPISIEQNDVPVQLLYSGRSPYVLQSGVISEQPSANHHSPFSAKQTFYQTEIGELVIPLVWQEGDIRITKSYRFDADSHEFYIDSLVENSSSEPWSGNFYAQVNRAPPGSNGDSYFINTYTGASWWTEETGFEKIDFDEITDESPSLQSTTGWLGMLEHYFVAMLIPIQDNNYFFTKQSNNQYIVGSVSSAINIPSNQSDQFSIKAFMGPKLNNELIQSHPTLDYAVDYGVFHVISAPLFWLLDRIHDWVGNWGVSIILITLLIKLAFYKLSEKSYRSMARMKKLTPRIQQLRERYADDKVAMNQKMMQIYKEEKVNPLGGCLPIILQIPVFISLYWVLVESVEIRQAPFVLWIQDLSIADPYFVLPILMGATMFFQQRLNPAPPDPTQAKVMQFLPVIFTVFFLFFPAGLVIYWVVNNMLSIAQQWYITKKIAEAN